MGLQIGGWVVMIQVKRNHIRAGLICTGLVRAVSIDTLSLLSLETGSGSQSRMIVVVILVRISVSFIIGDDRATEVNRRGRRSGPKAGESFEAWSTAQHANVGRR